MAINGIEITDVIIFPVKKKDNSSKLRAFARIVLNDQFIISGVRIFEGANGPFLRYPQELKNTGGKGYDICFPITAEMRTYMSDKVLEQYSINLNLARS